MYPRMCIAFMGLLLITHYTSSTLIFSDLFNRQVNTQLASFPSNPYSYIQQNQLLKNGQSGYGNIFGGQQQLQQFSLPANGAQIIPIQGRNQISSQQRTSDSLDCQANQQTQKSEFHQVKPSQQPGQFNQQPGQFNQQPGQFNQKPGQFNQQPGQFNQQPGQFNQQPGQFNQQPGQFNQQSGQYNQQQGQYNQQQGQYNQQQGQYNQKNTYQIGSNQYFKGQNEYQNVSPNLLVPINIPNQIDDSGENHQNNYSNNFILDNNIRELCKSPRSWDGVKCTCPNNGVFLSGKCYQSVPKENTRDLLSLRFINRNFDGSENNLKHPEFGAKGSPLLRITPPNYQDKKSEPLKSLPQPRQVSKIIGDIKNSIEQNTMLSLMFVIWSQFIGNDITYTPTSLNEFLNISVPKCDKFFDYNCSGKQKISFARSIYQFRNSIRTNINTVTSWLDGSHIYGSDKRTADSLRQFSGGKMKLTEDGLLPRCENGEFLSGDRRVNQNVYLIALQTIFVREHNRVCGRVAAQSSALTDEQIYQIARNYVIGLIQHITYDEWLIKLIGEKIFNKYIGEYCYDQDVNPSIFSEFQVAGLRVFDSFIPKSVFKMKADNDTVVNEYLYKDIVEKSKLINSNQSIGQFLSGAMRGKTKIRSVQIIDDLRNYFKTNDFPAQNTDLYAINIQRGRDHGIGSIEDARRAFRLQAKNISQIFANDIKNDCIGSLYQDAASLDLWLGLIGEELQQNTSLGETGNRIWTSQMKNIRNGDAYWYEFTYGEQVVKEIKETSLKILIERNSGNKNLPSMPFMLDQVVPPIIVPPQPVIPPKVDPPKVDPPKPVIKPTPAPAPAPAPAPKPAPIHRPVVNNPMPAMPMQIRPLTARQRYELYNTPHKSTVKKD